MFLPEIFFWKYRYVLKSIFMKQNVKQQISEVFIAFTNTGAIKVGIGPFIKARIRNTEKFHS
jgi:hypothetical protein